MCAVTERPAAVQHEQTVITGVSVGCLIKCQRSWSDLMGREPSAPALIAALEQLDLYRLTVGEDDTDSLTVRHLDPLVRRVRMINHCFITLAVATLRLVKRHTLNRNGSLEQTSRTAPWLGLPAVERRSHLDHPRHRPQHTCLLGLFSLVVLMDHAAHRDRLPTRRAA